MLLIPQRMQDSPRRLQKAFRYFKGSEGIRRASRSSYLLTGVGREQETLHIWESHLLVKAGDLGHSSLVNIKPLGVNFGIVSLREQLAPPSTKQKLVLPEPQKEACSSRRSRHFKVDCGMCMRVHVSACKHEKKRERERYSYTCMEVREQLSEAGSLLSPLPGF